MVLVIPSFCSGMAFLLYFDSFFRKSLTTPLQLSDNRKWKMSAKLKPCPLFNILFQLEVSMYLNSAVQLRWTLIERPVMLRKWTLNQHVLLYRVYNWVTTVKRWNWLTIRKWREIKPALLIIRFLFNSTGKSR